MLTDSVQWQRLVRHSKELESVHLRDLFKQDAERFSHFSLSAAGLTVDYSKNNLTAETTSLLLDLAKSVSLESYRDDMFSGKPINTTENRSVLHTALRNFSEIGRASCRERVCMFV